MVIKLKDCRIRHGMTIEELAEASHVSKAHIHYIESGLKVPTITVLCKLAKGLGVNAEDLYTCD
jgi:transcriptional regulator with XRE-family HTH domain